MKRISNNQAITKRKTLGSILQIIIGSVLIMVFWICSLVLANTYEQYLLFSDVENEVYSKFFDVFSMIAPFCICAILLIIAIIGKRYGLKKMYASALVCASLPVGTNILASFFSNDSNIFAYILIPVWIMLYPFGRMYWACIENASLSLDCYTDSEWIGVVIIISIIISAIVYKVCRTKNSVEKGDFIYD